MLKAKQALQLGNVEFASNAAIKLAKLAEEYKAASS